MCLTYIVKAVNPIRKAAVPCEFLSIQGIMKIFQEVRNRLWCTTKCLGSEDTKGFLKVIETIPYGGCTAI